MLLITFLPRYPPLNYALGTFFIHDVIKNGFSNIKLDKGIISTSKIGKILK